ncbi:hypothetical protein HK099_004314 [Clydaea vesicula]|uniref:Uncharacterized protein n=1 Tax=Clydaea vesicula TaxID=447962 RepID=A0AAD5UC27_9FUNG|nr:hypothetical protein HK099_004314 [Clydaea vesicula]KAJ3383063.1 hypothetical protein HDU92_004406 [Lobulomyces angularis]
MAKKDKPTLTESSVELDITTDTPNASQCLKVLCAVTNYCDSSNGKCLNFTGILESCKSNEECGPDRYCGLSKKKNFGYIGDFESSKSSEFSTVCRYNGSGIVKQKCLDTTDCKQDLFCYNDVCTIRATPGVTSFRSKDSNSYPVFSNTSIVLFGSSLILFTFFALLCFGLKRHMIKATALNEDPNIADTTTSDAVSVKSIDTLPTYRTSVTVVSQYEAPTYSQLDENEIDVVSLPTHSRNSTISNLDRSSIVQLDTLESNESSDQLIRSNSVHSIISLPPTYDNATTVHVD